MRNPALSPTRPPSRGAQGQRDDRAGSHRPPAHQPSGDGAGRPRTSRAARSSASRQVPRNAALVALSGGLPAQVLASILGLHPNIVVRWAGFARTSWADYLAARSKVIHGRRPGSSAPAPRTSLGELTSLGSRLTKGLPGQGPDVMTCNMIKRIEPSTRW